MPARSRPYQGSDDARAMRDLLVSMRAAIGHGCWHTGDLVWRLFLHSLRFDLSETVRLWEDGRRQLLGFAVLTPPSPAQRRATLYFDLQAHPGSRKLDLESRMLDWLASQAGEGVALATDTGVYETDRDQIAALEARGFQRAPDEALLLYHPLVTPLPEPRPPAGFTLRPLADPEEVGSRAAAHRDAFAASRISDEAYGHLLRTPGYRSEWDLLAVTGDGTIAAFCLVWVDAANRVAEFEPVGTRPAYRGRGLARSVLLEGLRRLKAAGTDCAVVGPIPAAGLAALRLYQSVGFCALHRLHFYTRDPTDLSAS